MTEDILFDNLYIGHSVEDAAALAAETWEVKKQAEKAKKAAAVEEDEEETSVKSSEEKAGEGGVNSSEGDDSDSIWSQDSLSSLE